MKKLYLTLAAVFLMTISCFADVFHGYIITKNGRRLTGYFTEMVYTGYSSQVVFINDFGSAYYIQPELIKAFVFRKNDEYLVYESKRTKTGWIFLRILYKGDTLNLYRSPEFRTRYVLGRGRLEAEKFEVDEFYIERPGGRLKRLRKWNYKRRLRKLIRKKAPQLAEKLGDEGYKFSDLNKIIMEYNQICEKTKYRI